MEISGQSIGASACWWIFRVDSSLATWCEELSHWKRPWCWERVKGGGDGDDRGWDGWMASLTQWTGVLENSGRWWRTEQPGLLPSMGSHRVGHDWATEQQPQDRHLPRSQWEGEVMQQWPDLHPTKRPAKLSPSATTARTDALPLSWVGKQPYIQRL